MNIEPDERMKRADAQEQLILDQLGAAQAFDAVAAALTIDQREDIYSYIIRCYDLDYEEEQEQ